MTLLLGTELLVIIAISLFGDLREHVPLFLVLFAIASAIYLLAIGRARAHCTSLPVILLWTVLLRVPMFWSAPSLSNDVWRYIHDGRAQLAGVNPYRYAPGDPATTNYRDTEFNNINHADLPTIYPPVAQFAFRLGALAPRNIILWRLLILAAEIGIVVAAAALLKRRGLDSGNLAVYAWHPLAIIESVGSAHLDSLGIAFMVGAIAHFATHAPVRAGILIAASVATKLIAAPVAVLMTRSWKLPVAAGVTVAAVYLPFVIDGTNALGSLGVFAERWESNSSLHGLLAPLVGQRTYRLTAAALLFCVVIGLRLRQTEIATGALITFMLLFLLAPVVHPWYLLWLLAIVPLRVNALDTLGSAALVWTLTVPLAYLALHYEHTTGQWHIPTPILWIEYLPVAAMLSYQMLSRTNLIPISRKTAAKI